MELNNIPNDKDTTVITPMQEQIRNVPKTDVEPTADFQVGELPKGGFTKVYDDDIYESEDGKLRDMRKVHDEVSKVTVEDAKEKAFPIMKGEDEAKPITLYDMVTVRDNATDQKVKDAWVEKMNKTSDKLKKKVPGVAKSFSKNGKGAFSNEDWTNLAYITDKEFNNSRNRDFYTAYILSAYNSDDWYRVVDRLKKLGAEYIKAANEHRGTDSLNLRGGVDDALKLLKSKDMEIYPRMSSAFNEGQIDAANEIYKDKATESEVKEDERIAKLPGKTYAQELKDAGLTEEAARQKMEEFNARHPNEPSVKFKVDEAINAVYPKAKPAAKVEKAKTTPKAAVETPVTSEAKAEKPKNAAEEKLEEKVNVSLRMTDALKEAGDDVYENAQAATEDLAKKAKKLNDGKDLMNNLPDFAINKLLRSEFGDLTVDKNGKKVLNSKALGTYGWFVLDNLGAALVNASLVARGMTPTQKSAYKQYLENEMLNAIGRKNKLTESINDIQLDSLVSDKELLTTIGTERIKLGSTEIDNALRAYQDDIDTAYFVKLLNENAQYLSTLSDDGKQEMLKWLAIQSQDADVQARTLGFMNTAALKKQLAQTEAERELAGIQVQQGNLELKMTAKDIAKAERALEIMQADLKQKYKNLDMTDLDMERLKLAIEKATKDNKYYEVEKVMGIVKEGTSTVTDVIKGFIEAFVPGK